jgi:hypothetical protein
MLTTVPTAEISAEHFFHFFFSRCSIGFQMHQKAYFWYLHGSAGKMELSETKD